MHTWSKNTYTGSHLKRDPITKKRVGLKFQIKERIPMSPTGYRHWGRLHKKYISKSPFVWRFYFASREFFPDGVPVKHMVTDKIFAEFLINTFCLADGFHYAVHFYSRRRGCRHGCGLTKKKFEIFVINVDKLQYRVLTSKMQSYWFRKAETQKRKEMWE